MFTRNWYKMLSVSFTSTKTTVTSVENKICDSFTSFDSALSYPAKSNSTVSSMYIGRIMNSYSDPYNCGFGGVILGTGNEKPTFDDYNLSGDPIPSTIGYTVNLSKTIDDSGATVTAIYTITNNGTEPITIGEIAIMTNFAAGATSKADKVIVEHTALETPITIPAGGVGQVTYTIRMNYPVG